MGQSGEGKTPAKRRRRQVYKHLHVRLSVAEYRQVTVYVRTLQRALGAGARVTQRSALMLAVGTVYGSLQSVLAQGGIAQWIRDHQDELSEAEDATEGE